MIVDTHMHTRFSTDSTMTIDEAMARGRELGIGITITEHMDLDYPQPKAFLFDIADYFRTYQPFRSDNVLLGIEIGMRRELVEKNGELLDTQPFDFVIGSIHIVDGIDIYQEEFYAGRSKAEVYDRYFTSMQSCVECYDFIDSLGHIDYMCRYAKFADPEIHYEEFADKIDGVLKELAAKEKAIEINTRRLESKATVEALIATYRRFRELGGRLATIGSDAHRPRDIGKNFAVAWEIADRCGLKPVWFQQRQPRYMSK